MTAAAQPSRSYAAVPAQIDLPAMEHEILELWDSQDTFAKSLERTRDGEHWTFYEGPPTANGMPGTHHIEARVFKDVFPRFRTMQGFRVDRKAGWDCHGLPVELAVERELGLNGKPDIEAFGVEAFNERCRASVQRHVDAFAELTERMGYWVNMDDAYWTMDPSYVQSVWWALKQIFEAGLLTEDFRVTPYCPRCGTGLSDHELAQGYETIIDPSVYVRLPLTSGPYAGEADLLIWTTTPWTLPSNALVAVKDDVTYTVASKDGEKPVVVAESLLGQALGEGWSAGPTFTGAEMVGWDYQRPFDIVEWTGKGHFVVTEDYVTTDDGTGLVHQATVFGADDMESVRRNGVELINPIDERGRFLDGIPLVGGTYFRQANQPLMDDLGSRGLLFRHLEYEHSYPHCWRCHSALMYYALPSWYIRTTKIKDELLRENEATNWHPENVKWGRYGDWLRGNVDWALSRRRYWGTPLPIWRNDADPTKIIAVGSLAELGELAGRDLDELDPHRPFVDDITFTRPGEEGTYRRVPEVIDAWFDSGSMPFAQWGFPHAEGSEQEFDGHYPADFISEAIDQTRGWFYTLMAVGTLVFDRNSYRNVVCLGHILAEDGRKMSKHLGNILEPIPLMDRHGADAVRWFMAAAGSPWLARRVGDKTITETVRKVLLTYWNTVAFQALYARAAGWSPAEVGSGDSDHVLDRWLRSATNVLVREVTAAYESFDTQRIGQLLTQFVDELSNWYVRRSRRRFWEGNPAALQTLHDTLHVLTRLMAPLVPFITERVWQDLFRASDPDGPESVHLADWPLLDAGLVDDDLDSAMDLTRRLVELGRAARADAQVKIRQPLRRALVPSRAYATLTDELRAEIAAELNLGTVEPFSGAGDLVDHEAKGNFRALGKRFGKQTPQVAAAIAAADAAALADALAAGGKAVIDFGGESVEVGPDEVIIAERPREGWSVVNEQGETIALDLALTPELIRAGRARDVVRFVQESRKNAGLDVSDRIALTWSTQDAELAEAVREHAALIADEVLAVEMTEADPGAAAVRDADLGLAVGIAKA
ncbi:isoleucyl-tRNA synthetase [Naumannella cuiyingiana]|uniref:Isoleucine--tRNA ligase n=1 Tax=Naumannella cuiyingiana TaxID=1347891 RepID=A0A7Z0D9A4_9ACTN|nr:isoleucine--tRNA ligase [Naumannella cuiyingiana]NYI71333.1 isoleucyl-tRNA synthetase [Naumannella cuiyingiana]